MVQYKVRKGTVSFSSIIVLDALFASWLWRSPANHWVMSCTTNRAKRQKILPNSHVVFNQRLTASCAMLMANATSCETVDHQPTRSPAGWLLVRPRLSRGACTIGTSIVVTLILCWILGFQTAQEWKREIVHEHLIKIFDPDQFWPKLLPAGADFIEQRKRQRCQVKLDEIRPNGGLSSAEKKTTTKKRTHQKYLTEKFLDYLRKDVDIRASST